MCGDSGIDSILITHPDRAARQQQALDSSAQHDIDLADAYVPFEPRGPIISNSTLLFFLIIGLILIVVGLAAIVAQGNALTTPQVVIHDQKGR